MLQSQCFGYDCVLSKHPRGNVEVLTQARVSTRTHAPFEMSGEGKLGIHCAVYCEMVCDTSTVRRLRHRLSVRHREVTNVVQMVLLHSRFHDCSQSWRGNGTSGSSCQQKPHVMYRARGTYVFVSGCRGVPCLVILSCPCVSRSAFTAPSPGQLPVKILVQSCGISVRL